MPRYGAQSGSYTKSFRQSLENIAVDTKIFSAGRAPLAIVEMQS
jgi:hypothetical protein